MFNGNKFFNDKMKKLYRESGVQVLQQCCPRHPNQHLLKFPSLKYPICPIDYQQMQAQKSREQANRVFAQHQHDAKIQSINNAVNDLRDNSIISDKSIRDATFDNFVAHRRAVYTGDRHAVVKKEAEIVAQHYISDPLAFNVIMYGNCGVGKSHLAMAILKYVNSYIGGRRMPNGQLGSCLFINLSALMLKIRDSFKRHDMNYQDRVIKLINHAYLVVLDDFGTELTTSNSDNDFMQFTQRILYEILNSRSRTIFTTNKNTKLIKRLYDPSIVSRMERNAQWITFEHIPDYRLNHRSNMFNNVYDPSKPNSQQGYNYPPQNNNFSNSMKNNYNHGHGHDPYPRNLHSGHWNINPYRDY